MKTVQPESLPPETAESVSASKSCVVSAGGHRIARHTCHGNLQTIAYQYEDRELEPKTGVYLQAMNEEGLRVRTLTKPTQRSEVTAA